MTYDFISIVYNFLLQYISINLLYLKFIFLFLTILNIEINAKYLKRYLKFSSINHIK